MQEIYGSHGEGLGICHWLCLKRTYTLGHSQATTMPLGQVALAHGWDAVTETRDKIRDCILEKLHLTFYVYLTGYACLTGGCPQQTPTLTTEALL